MIQIEIDMPKPKNCWECRFNYDYLYCCITESRLVSAIAEKQCLKDCPIKEKQENNN